ncbi:MAG: hypothetical protein RSC08_02695, partial [Oscillospiraceae bacterium]
GATTAAGVLATQSEAGGLYPAISAVDGTKHVTGVNFLKALVPAHATPATNADKKLITVNADDTMTKIADSTPLWQLKANEERIVDVYIWLEGTDADCLNELASYTYNLRLPFAASNTVAP